ncbi:MAG: MFS transporter [Nitriliruptorales bacterium]|nr:MFS transporter [Nitriliruptorales bacterium]
MTLEESAISARSGYRLTVGHPIALRLWLASGVSLLGDYVAQGALLMLAYQRTGLVLGSAAVFAVGAVPALLSGALAGSVLDRIPRGRALLFLHLAGAAFVLIPVVFGGAIPVFVAAALLGALRAAMVSVRSGAIAEGIGERYRPPLLALIGSTEQASQVIGYLAGTGLAVTLGAGNALVIDSVSFVLAAILLARLSLPEPTVRERPPITAGWRDIASDPVLRLLAPLVGVTALVGALPETLAAGVAGDSAWTPLVFAAAPAGQALTMLVLGRTRHVGRPSVQLTHLAWLALAFGIAALGRSAAWFVLANFLVGSGVAWTMGPQLTFLKLAPQERMAQITGTMIAVLIAAEGLGSPLLALLADQTSIAAVYRVAGFVVLAAALVGWRIKERTPEAIALDADVPTNEGEQSELDRQPQEV